jgi:hypothetical protein
MCPEERVLIKLRILYITDLGINPVPSKFPRQPSRGNSWQFEDLAVALDLAPTFPCSMYHAPKFPRQVSLGDSIKITVAKPYRGFLPKAGGIPIIIFRATTGLQSKSNCCI